MGSDHVKLTRKSRKLLELVPLDGDFIGNTTLLRRSGLGKRYWTIRKELVDKGLVARGKGRGGSIARVLDGTGISVAVPKKGRLFVRREAELYEPLRDWLQENWGQGTIDDGDFFEIRVTASPTGRKRSSGQWSRPDLTIVKVNSYEYLPPPVLDLTTFEVKKFSDGEKIRSVFEAAAHSRWAHHAYLVVEVPKRDYELPERFMSELERFRIGLILMWKTKEGWDFDEQEYETKRLEPEPDELNKLLKDFFRDDEKATNRFRQAIRK
jgi:hypothetical protein